MNDQEFRIAIVNLLNQQNRSLQALVGFKNYEYIKSFGCGFATIKSAESNEDAILLEVLSQLEISEGTLFEFGVGAGVQCNTLLLLKLKQLAFKFVWGENRLTAIEGIRTRHAKELSIGRLRLLEDTICPENVNELIKVKVGSPIVISVDIDGNDYHVVKAIEFKPPVFVVEYAAQFGVDVSVVQAYDPEYRFDRRSYVGTSLAGWQQLFRGKGYSLVACSLNGVNAFYVRDDLVNSAFAKPNDLKHHYRPNLASLLFFDNAPKSFLGTHEFD